MFSDVAMLMRVEGEMMEEMRFFDELIDWLVDWLIFKIRMLEEEVDIEEKSELVKEVKNERETKPK